MVKKILLPLDVEHTGAAVAVYRNEFYSHSCAQRVSEQANCSVLGLRNVRQQ